MSAAPAAAQTITTLLRAGTDSWDCVKATLDMDGNPTDFEFMPYNGGCPADFVPRVNETYIQSMHAWQSGGTQKLFFGSSGNVGCTTLGSTFTVAPELAVPPTYFAGFGMCAFELSDRAQSNGGDLPDQVADAWIPGLYVYDVNSTTLTKLAGSGAPNLPGVSQSRLQTSILVRAAVAWNNLAIFFTVPASGPVRAFAFNANTHAFLGSTVLNGITNMRKCIVVPGAFNIQIPYCTVQTSTGAGQVLRLTGTTFSPFSRTIVGNLGSGGANIAFTGGRVWVGTWPGGLLAILGPNGRAGVWRGPVHPATGYSALHRTQWTRVWEMGQLEQDSLIRLSNAVGDLTGCDDSVLFGTQQVPGGGAALHTAVNGDLYEPGGPLEMVDLFDETERPTTIFMIRNPNGSASQRMVEMQYGPATIPVFDGSVPVWNHPPTPGGPALHGNWGFGDTDNLYDWTAFEYNGRCFVGTFDSDLDGYDLWYFNGDQGPATRLTGNGGDSIGSPPVAGGGNSLQYGVRAAQKLNSSAYIGTAGLFNLDVSGGNQGGWELHKLDFPPAP